MFPAAPGEYVAITTQNQGANVSGMQIRVQDPNLTGGGYTVFKASTTGTYNILLQEVGQTSGPNDYGPLWNTVTWQITSA